MMFDMALADRLDGAHLLTRYDEWTSLWHLQPHSPKTENSFPKSIPDSIENLHLANFVLWHEEDKARDVEAGDAAIAAAKRAIDRTNQQRNNQIELCDALLLEELASGNLPNPQAELHSETPGLILDRLSILTLKRYHTLEEIERSDAPAGHRERNRQRLVILDTQRNDLAASLDRLWRRVLQGEVRFQVYRQLKMYNDPDLNPALYRRSGRSSQ